MPSYQPATLGEIFVGRRHISPKAYWPSLDSLAGFSSPFYRRRCCPRLFSSFLSCPPNHSTASSWIFCRRRGASMRNNSERTASNEETCLRWHRVSVFGEKGGTFKDSSFFKGCCSHTLHWVLHGVWGKWLLVRVLRTLQGVASRECLQLPRVIYRQRCSERW